MCSSKEEGVFMTISNKDLVNSILESLSRIEHINLEDIPDIDLYMDQVTTLMDSKLKATTRYPGEDKILTKTMINNYAKTNLLPPPQKKKYSKDHILLLLFIFYFKGVLSIADTSSVLDIITTKYFNKDKGLDLEKIYMEVFALEDRQIEVLREDILDKFKIASDTFQDAPEEDKEYLKTFSFICLLSFDVYASGSTAG